MCRAIARPRLAVVAQALLHVVDHGAPRPHRGRAPTAARAEEALVPVGHRPGVVIGLAPDHHAVDVRAAARRSASSVAMPPLTTKVSCGKVALQAVHDVVAQRRQLAVLLRAEALQPGVAGVDDEDLAAARVGDGADEIAHEVVALEPVDADAVLHRHRQRHRVAHRLDAVGDQRRLGHQAGAERAALHPLARAAAVEVDLVVAPALAEPRAGGELGRLAAAELQGHAAARPRRSRGGAARRRAAARRWSPSRCRAGRGASAGGGSSGSGGRSSPSSARHRAARD